MRFVTFVMIGAFAVLVACTPAPQPKPCDDPRACALTRMIEAEMAELVGEEFGGGVVMKNVQAAGSAIVFDLELPIPAAGLEQVQRRAVHELSARSVAAGICTRPDPEELFVFGISIQVRTLGSDGVLMGASSITSCGG